MELEYNNNKIIKDVLDGFEEEATQENENYNGYMDGYHVEAYSKDSFGYTKYDGYPVFGVMGEYLSLTLDLNEKEKKGFYVNDEEGHITVLPHFIYICDKHGENEENIVFNEQQQLLGTSNNNEYGYVLKNNRYYGILPNNILKRLNLYNNIQEFYKDYLVDISIKYQKKLYQEISNILTSYFEKGFDLEKYYLMYQLITCYENKEFTMPERNIYTDAFSKVCSVNTRTKRVLCKFKNNQK